MLSYFPSISLTKLNCCITVSYRLTQKKSLEMEKRKVEGQEISAQNEPQGLKTLRQFKGEYYKTSENQWLKNEQKGSFDPALQVGWIWWSLEVPFKPLGFYDSLLYKSIWWIS